MSVRCSEGLHAVQTEIGGSATHSVGDAARSVFRRVPDTIPRPVVGLRPPESQVTYRRGRVGHPEEEVLLILRQEEATVCAIYRQRQTLVRMR